MAAELADLDVEGLLDGQVAHLGALLSSLAETLDGSPASTAVPSLVLEFVRTHGGLLAAVEAGEGELPLPVAVAIPPARGGLVTEATSARLAELGIDPATDALAAVAALASRYLDDGAGPAAPGISKALRAVMAALRPRVVEIDEAMAELLAPLETPRSDPRW